MAEFGRPADLAVRLAGDERLTPAWMRSIAVQIATMVPVVLGAALLVSVLGGENPVAVTVGQVCWALLFAAMVGTMSHLTINRLDGRSLASAIEWPVRFPPGAEHPARLKRGVLAGRAPTA